MSSILLLALFMVLLSSSGWACQAYWTGVAQRPEYIVVGTMHNLSKSDSEFPINGEQRGNAKVIGIRDCGNIVVERVLLGKSGPKSISVSWFARTRLDPPQDYFVDISTSMEFSEGEKRIWVLWKNEDHDELSDEPYHIQALHLDRLDQVLDDIAKLDIHQTVDPGNDQKQVPVFEQFEK